MRKLFAATFAAVMIAVLFAFVVVARSIYSPIGKNAPIALEAECPAPGVSNAEQFACASCSHAKACTHDYLGSETEVVRDHSTWVAHEKRCGARSLANDCVNGNCKHRATAYLADGFHLKLPSDAVVVIENTELRQCNPAIAANRLEVEVLGVGV